MWREAEGDRGTDTSGLLNVLPKLFGPKNINLTIFTFGYITIY